PTLGGPSDALETFCPGSAGVSAGFGAARASTARRGLGAGFGGAEASAETVDALWTGGGAALCSADSGVGAGCATVASATGAGCVCSVCGVGVGFSGVVGAFTTTATGLELFLSQYRMPYPAPAPTRMIASRPTITSFLIRFARAGLPKRKLASAAGCGGGAGFRPAIDLAFSSAFKIKLIWL